MGRIRRIGRALPPTRALLWACKDEVVGGVMREQTKAGSMSKARTGRAVLWAGSLVLLGESWLLLEQAREIWAASGATTLGYAAGVAALAHRVLSILVWQDGLLLAAMAKVLVLCCPLLVIAVGLGMVRKANLLEASSNAEEISPAREERS